MKKYLIPFSLLILLAACGGNNSNPNPTPAVNNDSASDITKNPDYIKGKDLASGSDCFTCHQVNQKSIGPPYQDVANKYAGNDTAVNYLINKIIKGGKGVWVGDQGQTPIMTPHPLLSRDTVRQIVKYILLLKTK